MSANRSGTSRKPSAHAVLDALSANVAVLDRAGLIVAVNEAWTDFGTRNGAAPGKIGLGVNYLDVCRQAADQGVESAIAALAGLQSVLAVDQPKFLLEYPCHSPTERRWFQLQAMPLKQPAGGIVTTHLVITRQKEIEDRFREREARLEAILQKAVDGIITLDDQGRIETLNLAALRLFNYRASQLVGQEVSILMPESYRARHRLLIQQCASGEMPLPAPGREIIGLRSDGSCVPLELTISMVQLRHRKFFTAIVRDISERKRAAERILLNERLAAIGEAMTGLIHEGRNALQRGQASVELLRLQLQDQSRALELLERIQRSQNDLHRLYEDVRQYAQPIQIQPRACNVSTLLREAWDHLAIRTKNREIALYEHGYRGSLICHADPFAMRRVFVNLFENALDACPDPVEIDVVFENRLIDNKLFLAICIGDNGPGMSLQTIEHAFDPFYTTKTHGIGLGLPLSRRVLQAHGGDLLLVADRHRGVEFQLLLLRPPSEPTTLDSE